MIFNMLYHLLMPRIFCILRIIKYTHHKVLAHRVLCYVFTYFKNTEQISLEILFKMQPQAHSSMIEKTEHHLTEGQHLLHKGWTLKFCWNFFEN